MAQQLRDLLAGPHVVEPDYAGVARGGEEGGQGGEADAADWGEQAWKRVQEAGGRVVEDVEAAVLVAGGEEGGVGGLKGG